MEQGAVCVCVCPRAHLWLGVGEGGLLGKSYLTVIGLRAVVRQVEYHVGWIVHPGRHLCLEHTYSLPSGWQGFPGRPHWCLRALSLPLCCGVTTSTGPHSSSLLRLLGVLACLPEPTEDQDPLGAATRARESQPAPDLAQWLSLP